MDEVVQNIFISFYKEYLHDIDPEVIVRKKQLADKKLKSAGENHSTAPV
jgi:hypothetical protein